MATTRRLPSSAAVPRSILYDNTKLSGCPDPGRWEAAANARLHGASVPLSVRGQVRPAGQGQRQGQGRGTGRLHPAELPGPRSRVPRASRPSTMLSPNSAAGARRRVMRGHKETIGERLERDRQVLLPLPPAPYDACDKRPGRASSLSLVRYRTNNDYSVPVAYGHREVLIRGYVDEVAISCGAEVIARHRRSYDSEVPDLRPAALPALDRAEDRRPRPGRAIGGLGPARGLHHSAAAPRSSYGQGRQARVRPGAPVYWRPSGSSRRSRVRSATPCGSAQSALIAVKHLVLCRIERRPPSSSTSTSIRICRAPGSR